MNTLLVLLISLPVAHSYLSPQFYEWINETYGENMANRLNRQDLGEQGSFGGGTYPNTYIRGKYPVLLVHGVTDWAGYYGTFRHKFLSQGYLDGEVYGTTYGGGKEAYLYTESMKCDYVKQVREMLLAVSNYTNSKLDIVAYSLGSPVARKAILGGKCVDTGEELGDPLTDHVHIFLGVAGANYGSSSCFLVPLGICNLVNGLYCGSKFLNDINSKEHYEGTLVAVMYSTDDDMVGYKACGDKILSSIKGSDYTVVKEGLTHRQILDDTLQEQYELIRVKLPSLEKSQEAENA